MNSTLPLPYLPSYAQNVRYDNNTSNSGHHQQQPQQPQHRLTGILSSSYLTGSSTSPLDMPHRNGHEKRSVGRELDYFMDGDVADINNLSSITSPDASFYSRFVNLDGPPPSTSTSHLTGLTSGHASGSVSPVDTTFSQSHSHAHGIDPNATSATFNNHNQNRYPFNNNDAASAYQSLAGSASPDFSLMLGYNQPSGSGSGHGAGGIAGLNGTGYDHSSNGAGPGPSTMSSLSGRGLSGYRSTDISRPGSSGLAHFAAQHQPSRQPSSHSTTLGLDEFNESDYLHNMGNGASDFAVFKSEGVEGVQGIEGGSNDGDVLADGDDGEDGEREGVAAETGADASHEGEGDVDNEEPLYVNAKQYHRILKRRMARARLEELNRLSRSRKPYLHESRHRHACSRPRGKGGRFLTAEEIEVLKKEQEAAGISGSAEGSSRGASEGSD